MLRAILPRTTMIKPYTGPWSANRVREEFFAFFRSKNHVFAPSSPTIPFEDPTLLFANAGMNQVLSQSIQASLISLTLAKVQINLSWHSKPTLRNVETQTCIQLPEVYQGWWEAQRSELLSISSTSSSHLLPSQILKTLDETRIIIPSLRCWVTGLLGITSRFFSSKSDR
jgi:tRNA synthetases class II (A)